MDPLRNEVPAPANAQVPLGQLLVDAGLIELADLEKALEEQRRTGRRLGELLVEGGYVAGRSIALALARQHGGLVATEYGFATAGTRPDSDAPGPSPPADAVVVEIVPIYKDPEAEPPEEPEPAAVEADVDEPEEAEEVPRSYAADRHVLFIPDPAGYRVIERNGPCPAAGETATLDFGSFLVGRVGPSPFPGERVACAFLEPR